MLHGNENDAWILYSDNIRIITGILSYTSRKNDANELDIYFALRHRQEKKDLYSVPKMPKLSEIYIVFIHIVFCETKM